MIERKWDGRTETDETKICITYEICIKYIPIIYSCDNNFRRESNFPGFRYLLPQVYIIFVD